MHFVVGWKTTNLGANTTNNKRALMHKQRMRPYVQKSNTTENISCDLWGYVEIETIFIGQE